MPGAIIRIDQDRPGPSVSSGTAGVARKDLWVGNTIRPTSTVGGNSAQQWTLLDKPVGSTSVISNPTSVTCSFTPDIAGSYRIRLITNTGGAGHEQILIAACTKNSTGVTIYKDWRIPAFGEKKEESNFSSQTRGWAEAFDVILGDVQKAFLGLELTVGPSALGATYVTDGTADDVEINAAIAAASAAGGGIVRLLRGTYNLAARVNLASNVILEGAGADVTTLIAQNTIGASEPWTVGAAGSLTTGTASNLASNAVQGATTIVATAGAEYTAIAAEDYLFLISDGLWESLNQSNRERGEFVRVVSKSSPNLTLYGAVRDSYTTSDTGRLYRVSFVDSCGIRNLSIKQSAALNTRTGPVAPLVSFQLCRNAFVENCELYNNDGPGVVDFHSVGTSIRNNYIHDLTDTFGSTRIGNGVLIGGCSENTVVTGNRFDRMRHAIESGPGVAATGFSAVTNNGIPRGVVVSGNTVLRIANSGISSQNEAEGWEISSNLIENCESCGVSILGRSMVVLGNTIAWCSGGVQLGSTAYSATGGSGAGSKIIGNSISHIKSMTPGSTGTNFSGYGVILSGTDNVTVQGNTISSCDAAGIRLRQYTRRSMICRNAILNANLLNTGNMPAVEVEAAASGSAATLTLGGSTITVTGLSGVVNLAFAKNIVISGAATAANNGTFPIASVVSSSSVTYSNGLGATDANNGAISWYIESVADNVLDSNVAMNTAPSEYDRDATGHAKYMVRDTSTGNVRNTYSNNTGSGMETDLLSIVAAYNAVNNTKDGKPTAGNEKHNAQEYPISAGTTTATPLAILTVGTVSGRNYAVRGYIQGTNGTSGRWLYDVDAFFDNNAGTLTQRIGTPVTERDESNSSVTLTCTASGTNIVLTITAVSGAITWTGRIFISEARV